MKLNVLLHLWHLLLFDYQLLIIILCFVFKGMNQRNGTDVDAANVMKVFTKLGYKVKIYNDQTVDQMKLVLTSGKFGAEFIQNHPTVCTLTTQMNTKSPNY